MKKVFVVLLMLLYGISSSGMLVQLHYCNNNLSEISLNSKQADCCCESENEKSNDDCCENQVISAKIDIDQYISSSEIVFAKQIQDCSAVLPIIFVPYTAKTQSKVLANIPNTLLRHKTRWQDIPIYKRNLSFIYYS